MTLEADGIIEVWEIDTGKVIAQYEGLDVHDAMQSIAQLRATLEAVPLQEIFRFVQGAQYDPRSGARDDYMPDDYDSDRAVIDAWLQKELSAE